jgi:RNA polymerase sigma-70 factor, ECF subfamily
MSIVETDVVALVDRGEPDLAFGRLYDEYGARLFGLCRSMARADVDDAFQEVLLAIYRALPRFRGESKLFTWCYRIAVRVTLRHMARHRRHGTGADSKALASPPATDLAAGPDAAQSSEELARIRSEIDKLPLIYRLPILLHAQEGHTTAEMAAILGVSVATVWTRLHRGRRRLAAALGTAPGAEQVTGSVAEK